MDFEYAGHQFKLQFKTELGSYVVDCYVESVTPEGKVFLDNEKYYHNAFITGRNIWRERRKHELEEMKNVKCEVIGN